MEALLTPRRSRYCPHAPTEQQATGLVAHRFLPDDEPSEVLYGGAAGGGKSDWLLMGALEYVDVPGYAAIVFRRTFTDLSLPGAIMHRASQWLSGSDAHWSGDLKRWTFPSGAALQFAYMDHDGDEERYQSAEFQYVAFDELTQFPEAQYTYLFSRLRRPERGALSRVPLRMRAASNPGGVGHGWVLKRFPIDGEPRGRRVFIPAKIADNPHLDEVAYRASLARLGDVRRKQLEEGDWQAAEGLAFSLDRLAHVVPELDVPAGWERFESMDFGVANPTCVLMWAVDYDGNHVIFDSYYRGEALVSEHAREIEARRSLWWPSGQAPVSYADPSMWAKKGGRASWGEPASDITEFEEHGLRGFVQANNRRRPGRVRVAELLEPVPHRLFPGWHPRAGEAGAPRLFIVGARCPELVEQVEAAPLLPLSSGLEGAGEIIDPKWETRSGHATAALRYGAMSRVLPNDAPPAPDQHLVPPVPASVLRREALRREIERRENPHEFFDRSRFVY